jgi:hypothetical protein
MGLYHVKCIDINGVISFSWFQLFLILYMVVGLCQVKSIDINDILILYIFMGFYRVKCIDINGTVINPQDV